MQARSSLLASWRWLACAASVFVVACAPAVEPAEAPPPSPAPRPVEPAPRASAPPPSARPPSRPPRRVPKDPAECVAMLGTAEAAQDEATVTPEQGSGKSERFAGIVKTLKSQRGALRCCYDLWSQEHPRDAGLTLAFAIDEAGGISGIQIKGDANNAFAMEAGGCIVDVALGMRYPASPSGRVTTFEYDLGFVHRAVP